MITAAVNKEIEGYLLQLQVTCNLWGEVLEIENPLLALPVEAEKLTIGDLDLLDKIKAYQDLLYYKIPFALAQNLIDEDIKELLSSINAKRKISAPASEEINSQWVIDLYANLKKWRETKEEKELEQYERINKGFKSFFLDLDQLYLEGLDDEGPIINLKEDHPFARLSISLFPMLADYFGPYHKRDLSVIFFIMDGHLVDSNRDLLIRLFKDLRIGNLRFAIAYSLKYYKADQKVYELFYDFWINNPNASVDFQALILKYFEDFSSRPETLQIAWESIQRAGPNGIKILKNGSISDKAIAKVLTPILLDPTKRKQHRSVFESFSYLENPYVFPPLEAFLDAYNKAADYKYFGLEKILKICNSKKIPELILKLLSHEDPLRRTKALHIINGFYGYNSGKIPSSIRERMKELITDEDQDVSNYALHYLDYVKGDLGLVNEWAALVRKDKEKLSKVIAKLNRAMPKLSSQEKALALPIYQSALRLKVEIPFDDPYGIYDTSFSNGRIIADAIYGLTFYEDDSISKEVQPFLHYEENYIQDAAKRYFGFNTGIKRKDLAIHLTFRERQIKKRRKYNSLKAKAQRYWSKQLKWIRFYYEAKFL